MFFKNRFNLFNEIICFRAVEKGMQDRVHVRTFTTFGRGRDPPVQV